MPSPFSRWWGKRPRPEGSVAWSDVRREAERSTATPIAEAEDRQLVAIKGRVESLTPRTRDHGTWLEAELSDGTGVVTLVWMGRSAIPGVEVGRVLRVEGRIGLIDEKAHIYNPRYTLL